MTNNQYLLELRSDHRFNLMIEAMKLARPTIPSYSPNMDKEHWVYSSGMRDGFDLALTMLGISPQEFNNE